MKYYTFLATSVIAAGVGDRVSTGSSGLGGVAIIGTDCETMGNWGCRSQIVDEMCCGTAAPDNESTVAGGNQAL